MDLTLMPKSPASGILKSYSFGTESYRCLKCGQEVVFYEVWHPKYGTVYDICRDQN